MDPKYISPRKSPRKHFSGKVATAIIASVVFALVVGGVVYLWQEQRIAEREHRIEKLLKEKVVTSHNAPDRNAIEENDCPKASTSNGVSSAASYTKYDFPELVGESNIILTGTLIEKQRVCLSGENEELLIGVIKVEEVLKGPAGGRIVFISLPAPREGAATTRMTHEQGQQGLWFLRKSEQYTGLYLADHPQRFRSVEDTGSDTFTPNTNSATASTPNSFHEYSWIPQDVPGEEVDIAKASIEECMSKNTSMDDCVGVWVAECERPQAQCYYIEASAWDHKAFSYYQNIAEHLNDTDPLSNSHTHWRQFAEAECGLTHHVLHPDRNLQRSEGARCALVMTAERTSMLRGHMRNLE